MDTNTVMTTLVTTGMWNNSPTAASSEELSAYDFPLYIAVEYIHQICPPLILLFGTFGNVMTIIIMHRLASASSVINVYFTATAVADTLCLYVNTFDFVLRIHFNYDYKRESSIVCKMYVLVYGVAGTISGWFLVCMTVHRAVSILWPHRVNVLCTRRTALLLLAGITGVNVLLFSHFVVGFDLTDVYTDELYCHLASKEYADFIANIFIYVDMVVVSVLPFIILSCANCVLAWALITSAQKSGETLGQGSSDQIKARKKEARSVTLTVLTVSLAFLLLTLPYSINYSVNFHTAVIRSAASLSDIVRGVFISNVCDMLRQSNTAINFYLYVLTGKRFREESLKVLCFWKRSATVQR